MSHSWVISSHAGSASIPSRGKFSAKTSTATSVTARTIRHTQSNTRLLLPVTGNAVIETIPWIRPRKRAGHSLRRRICCCTSTRQPGSLCCQVHSPMRTVNILDANVRGARCAQQTLSCGVLVAPDELERCSIISLSATSER